MVLYQTLKITMASIQKKTLILVGQPQEITVLPLGVLSTDLSSAAQESDARYSASAAAPTRGSQREGASGHPIVRAPTCSSLSHLKL